MSAGRMYDEAAWDGLRLCMVVKCTVAVVRYTLSCDLRLYVVKLCLRL